MVYAYYGVLLNNKTEQMIDIGNTMDGSQKCYAGWIKTIT